LTEYGITWRAVALGVMALCQQYGWECTGSHGQTFSFWTEIAEAAVVVSLRMPNMGGATSLNEQTRTAGIQNWQDTSRRLIIFDAAAVGSEVGRVTEFGFNECLTHVLADVDSCLREVEDAMRSYRTSEFELLTGLLSEESLAAAIRTSLGAVEGGAVSCPSVITFECFGGTYNSNPRRQTFRVVTDSLSASATEFGIGPVGRLHTGSVAAFSPRFGREVPFVEHSLKTIKQAIRRSTSSYADSRHGLQVLARTRRLPRSGETTEQSLRQTGKLVGMLFI
jgi:hypothetical protein